MKWTTYLATCLVGVVACRGAQERSMDATTPTTVPANARANVIDGVYMTCRGIQGFAGSTLELQNGSFRFWTYSDVSREGASKQPQCGTYAVEGRRLDLQSDSRQPRQFLIADLDGTPALWTEASLDAWVTRGVLNDYQVLVKTHHVVVGDEMPRRPSNQVFHIRAAARKKSLPEAAANEGRGVKDSGD